MPFIPYKFTWLAFVIGGISIGSFGFSPHRLTSSSGACIAGYALGVCVPSLFSWASSYRLRPGNVKRSIIFYLCWLILSFGVFAIAQQFGPNVSKIENLIESFLNSALWAYLLTSSDDNDEKDLLKGTSSKIEELVQRVREVHGPSSVPLPA